MEFAGATSLNAPQETTQSYTCQGVCWRNIPERSALKEQKHKKIPQASLDNFFMLLFLFVTLKGVEPSTAGAEIQCSIQLSYKANIFLPQ